MGLVRLLALVSFSLACSRPAAEPAASPRQAAAGLINTELAFAGDAATRGITPAFVAALADDGVLFRPTAVVGKKWLAEHPADPGRLSWRPTYAEVSRAGDLGFTTGPWEYRREADATRAQAYGHFVSAWRRGADGVWRLAADIGISHPPPDDSYSLQSAMVSGSAAPTPPPKQADDRALAEGAAALRALDDTLRDAVAASGPGEYRGHLADDVRYYRPGAFPAVGRHAVEAALASIPAGEGWRAEGGRVSASGDLGYSYGTQTLPDSAGQPIPAVYLHVWRRQNEGPWRLALDLAHPAPP